MCDTFMALSRFLTPLGATTAVRGKHRNDDVSHESDGGERRAQSCDDTSRDPRLLVRSDMQ